MPLYYAIVLLLLFYLFIVGEFFLPTGGLLGAAATVSVLAAIVIAFTHSMTAGFTVVFFVAATTPALFMFMIRLWPHTAIGRRVLNRKPGETTSGSLERTMADGTPISELVGQIGVAKTDLLPSGMVRINSQKIDAVSTGMPVDIGTMVVVTKVHAGKIHVRPALEHELQEPSNVPESPASLEKPLESFDIEELEP